jgi:hypothetical protein
MYRIIHRWSGRIIVLFGFISFIAGSFRMFVERYNPALIGAHVGLTVGGLLQIISSIIGLVYIRPPWLAPYLPKTWKKDIRKHKICMYFVFFAGCLVPAFMRLPNLVTLGPINLGVEFLVPAIVVPMAIIYPMAIWTSEKKRFFF